MVNKIVSFALLSFAILFASIGFAQNNYTHLLTAQYNPFVYETGLLDSAKVLQDVHRALLETISEEEALIAKRAQIDSMGYGAEEFLMHVKEKAQTMSESEVDFKDFQAFIQAGQIPVQDFFKGLDSYIQDYLDVAMALSYHSARQYIIEMKIAGMNIEPLRQTFEKLEKYKDQYVLNKDQYQKPKDMLRTTPYKKFFVTMKGFLSQLEVMPQSLPPSPLKVRLRSLAKNALLAAKLAPSAMRLVKEVLVSAKPDSEVVPLSRAIFKAVRKVGDIQDLSVVVEGRENLPAENRADTVNIFVGSHRHGLHDVYTTSALNIDSMVFFGAPNNFLPSVLNKIFGLKNKIIDRLNNNLGFIVVGKGSSPEPIEKALKIVRESSVRNFFSFLGGRLPEGLGATMGVREGFYSLVAAFENAGYKVNLVPISFPNNARLFDNESFLSEDEPKTLKVEVYPSIDDKTRRLVVKAGGNEALSLLMRFGLTESLPTDENLIWGQVRATKLFETLNRFNCSEQFRLLKANL